MSLKYKLAKRWKQLKAYLFFVTPTEKKPLARKTALISITKISPNRRLFHICGFLHESGYQCHARLSLSEFFSMDPYGIKALFQFNIHSCRHHKTNFDLFITDSEAIDTKTKTKSKTLLLDYSVFDRSNDYAKGMFYPIHFHPDFMNFETEKNALSFSAEKNRKISILFAGNCDKESYDSEETINFFHIHTRWDIFSFLEQSLSSDEMFRPSSYREFCQARENGALRGKIVLIDINKFKIPQSDWFDILGDTDFFLHLPGYIQPWCHNQIESMAAGAVPITEFPHIFHPSLQNGKNAVTYGTKDELLLAIRQIVRGSVSKADIVGFRENLMDYYLEHFSFRSFTSALDDFIKSPAQYAKLYICAGDFSLVRK